ncbi:MAG: hypothetical protein VX034_15445, partial [Planctomycetota bacterium]|nr:hypothetical protein [Planctomycetota bacterium]
LFRVGFFCASEAGLAGWILQAIRFSHAKWNTLQCRIAGVITQNAKIEYACMLRPGDMRLAVHY